MTEQELAQLRSELDTLRNENARLRRLLPDPVEDNICAACEYHGLAAVQLAQENEQLRTQLQAYRQLLAKLTYWAINYVTSEEHLPVVWPKIQAAMRGETL